MVETNSYGCCSFHFPDIPRRWLLFIEFAFTFGTTIIYFADIVTDIITLRMYYERGWYHAFGFSVCFIVLPSLLLAVLEYKFLRKTYGKSVPWKTIVLRTILNVPFQLTVIWYHCQLTYTYLRNWLDYIRGIQGRDAGTTAQWYGPTTLERSRGASLSSLNELDAYIATEEEEKVRGSFRVPPPPAQLSQSMTSLDNVGANNEKDNWWKRLTREQWLSHLNKQKLTESMLESLPQLLINLYLIAYHRDTVVIQYISAVLSYVSLCGGVVRYDKTRKDNEADRWMVDRTLLHSRAFDTRLEWPQLLFISLFKGSFLAARILAFVFFTIYFRWYILLPVIVHWAVLLCYFVYKWFPDFSKVTRQLRQADYNYRAYIFLSHDFMSVLHASLMGIFIHVRPYYHAFLDQPYCFMFWYYVVYVTENACLFLIPGIVLPIMEREDYLTTFQYYGLLATDLVLNVAGCTFCVLYYLAVHKMRAYTAHAYPIASKILCCCCLRNHGKREREYWLPVKGDWTVCKQAETSELFWVTKEQLKSFQQTYNTMVRNDRRRGRTIECFIDDRCRIFYAPRSKMKKIALKSQDDETPRPSLRKLKDSSQDQSHEMRELMEDDIFLEERRNEVHSKAADSQSDQTDYIISSSEAHSPMVESPDVDLNLERPVKKPRVLSLRQVKPDSVSNSLDHKDAAEGDNHRYDEKREDGLEPLSLPSRPPRSINVQDQSVPLGAASHTSTSPASHTSTSPRSSLSSPQDFDSLQRSERDDAPALKVFPEIDDSTYRVPKHKKKTPVHSKRKKKDSSVRWEDGVDLVSSLPVSEHKQSEEPRYHDVGEVVDQNSGWQQTWI